MRRTFAKIITPLLMLCFSLAAYAEVHVYTGNVGPYPVKVTLNLSGDTNADGVFNVNGSYTYTKAGNTLYLSGEYNFICRCPWIIMDEYTKSGVKSAEWSLEFTKTGLVGTMTVTKNGKTYNVRLREKK